MLSRSTSSHAAVSTLPAGDFAVALDEARELDEDITMRRLTLTRSDDRASGEPAAGVPLPVPRVAGPRHPGDDAPAALPRAPAGEQICSPVKTCKCSLATHAYEINLIPCAD